jgi:hypothetical protein
MMAPQGLALVPYHVILHGTGNVEGTMRLVMAALGLTFILAAGAAQAACPGHVQTADNSGAVVAQGGGSGAPVTRIKPQAQQQGG